jgi:peroxiredoxin Q/BCP
MNENMIQSTSKKIVRLSLLVLGLLWNSICFTNAAQPQVGEMAPEFSLKTLDGKTISLRDLNAKQRVVLVVLRGWPGYQCPLCQQQVHDLVSHSTQLNATKANMLFVYPGPSAALQAHAEEFLKDKQWPKNWSFAIDPDYSMVSAYDLRWDAKNETAYPSTFILEPGGKIAFAKISKEHGGRVSAKELLNQLESKP